MAIKKRGLIMYASVTGNTEKVAKAFAKAFENCGWSYDLVKIDKKQTSNRIRSTLMTTTLCVWAAPLWRGFHLLPLAGCWD